MTDDEVAQFGRAPDAERAGLGCLETARGRLPLVALEVDARVAGIVASIEVAQQFVNTTGTPIEATYIFPLPDRAAVHRFRMEVAGRVVDGVVDERGAAREQYDEAIARGQRAAIAEEERAGVFTLRVGNLLPGEVATVRLSLVGPLPVDDGEVTFRFPLVVAPRYIPGVPLAGEQAGLGAALDTSLVPDASRISPPVRLPGFANPVRLGLRVVLEDASAREVTSSLHAVTSVHRDANVIEVQPGERLDRDFILRWRVDGAELASSLRCIDDADGKAGTFLVTLVPPSTVAVAGKPRDVVFVLDRSGSMRGWKLVAARRAVGRMIDTLTSRDRFCTIAFDNACELAPASGLVAGTDRARFAAVEAVAKIEARGGTELAHPLQRAQALLAGGTLDRERMIVLVTDGQVGNEDHIVRELAPALRNIKVFTLGIDQAVNAAFLRRLAAAGGGLCELVESEDRLDAVMAKVHRRIGLPVATELALVPTGLAIEPTSIAPAKLPDVYAGAPVTILGRYRGAAPADAHVELVGTTLGAPLRTTLARTTRAHDARDAAWLAASWARARIRDLEDRYAAGAHDVEPAIVAVSKQFGVLSRFTAYLAIDRAERANPGGRVQQIVQPVDLPAGWEDSGPTLLGAPSGPESASADARRRFESELARAGGDSAPTARDLIRLPPRIAAPPAGAARSAPKPAPGDPPAAPTSPPAPSAPVRARFATPSELARTTRAKRPLSGSRSRGETREAPELAVGPAYLLALATLAGELEAHARANAMTLARFVHQRLAQWIEDVRSVGGLEAFVAAVEALVARLATATPDEAIEIAGKLAELATGGMTAPGPKPPGRDAFWK